MANTYANDDSCSFLALATKRKEDCQQERNDGQEEEDDTIIAVANYKRLPAQNAAWIEAVRTHSSYRNQGLASKLLQSIVELAKEEDKKNNYQSPTNVLTCTVKSNMGMQRVFDKLGFVQTDRISILSFSALRQLPGWDAKDTTTSQGKPLLDALDLNHLLSPDARSIPASSWSTITTENQLLALLKEIQSEGGCGYLPGLHEYIVPGPNRVDLKQSMERGLVLELNIPPDNKEMSGCDEKTPNDERSERAILAFTQDKRISSLKSNWVCSISAHSTLAFEAALCHAHSPEIAHRINGTADMVPFCLTFDGAVPVEDEGTIAHALPREADECVVFSYRRM